MTVGRYVISFTNPGRPRMPNGVESEIQVPGRGRVAIGRGRIELDELVLAAGPAWDPVPHSINVRSLPPGPEPVLNSLAAIGLEGPSGPELIAGYVAGLALLHDQRDRARRIADRVAAHASPLAATLLAHASRGEVPEPVHTLLATGDPRPLLQLEAVNGHGWLRGLVSAGLALETWPVTTAAPDVKAEPAHA